MWPAEREITTKALKETVQCTTVLYCSVLHCIVLYCTPYPPDSPRHPRDSEAGEAGGVTDSLGLPGKPELS